MVLQNVKMSQWNHPIKHESFILYSNSEFEMIIRRKNWDNQFYETVIKNENKKKSQNNNNN